MKTKLFLFVMLLSCPFINAQIVNVYAPRIVTEKVQVKRIVKDSTRGGGATREIFKDSVVTKKEDPIAPSTFQWFEGGNIDYISSGLLQTNARVLRINLGIPNKVVVPFYITAGADKQTTNDPDEDPNKSTNVNLLSANGGYLNFGFNGNHLLKNFTSDTSGKTRLSAVYLLGAKMITGKDATTEERINLMSWVSNVGLMFQTNAWDADDVGKKGTAWIQAVFTNTFNNGEKIKKIYGDDVKKNFYGYNIEGGIQIDNLINLRLGYYKYLNNEDINKDFKDGIFKLSVDFALTK